MTRRRFLDWRVAAFDAAAFFIPLIVYGFSISRWPFSWDYGEMQTVPYMLGIPHPTGFPLFVLLGWLFSHAVPVATPAWRMNFLCSLFMAGSALALRRLALALGSTQWCSLAASFAFAFTEIAWLKAVHADVHTLALLLSLFVFLAAVDFAKTRNLRSLLFGAAAYGCGLATHPNVLWSGLALVYGFWIVARRDARTAALVVAAALAPLLLYAYLPIRSAVVEASHVDPAANAPFLWHGELVWDSNRPSTLEGFTAVVSGSQFSAADSLDSIFDVALYPVYVTQWFAAASKELLGLTIVFAAASAIVLVRRAATREAALCVLAGGFAAVPFAYSYGPEMDVARYLLPSLAVTAAFAAAASGLAKTRFPALGFFVTLAMAGIAASLYEANTNRYGSRNDTGGQATIDGVRTYVPDGAVVVAHWEEATALAYGSYVDQSLGRRIVLLWGSDDAKLYPGWTSQYRVFVLSNFAIKDQLEQSVLKPCLRLMRSPDLGDKQLYEIRCPPGWKSP